MAEKITLKNDIQSVDLEIKDASVGPNVIDLKSLSMIQAILPSILHTRRQLAAKVKSPISMEPMES